MGSTDDRWSAAERLFHQAANVEGPEREQLLARACAGDPDLRREVEELLAADRDATQHSALHGIDTGWLTGAARADMIGRTVGPYYLQSIIASGGMGDVYLADEAALGRKVAVKLLPDSFARDPERVRRFTDEARAISALNHPHIVVIHQIGEADGRPYLATEFVEGETLRARIARGPLPLVDALAIAMQIAGAIEAAHAAGIVHRDLKPENVLVRPDGYVKVLDFGLAKHRRSRGPEDDATKPGAVMGTPAYMSPEQALGQEVDHRTDIFSLGAVLYEMVTGTPPFRGRTDSEMRASLRRGESTRQATFADIVARALAKDPEHRQQSMTTLKGELRELHRLVDSQIGGTAIEPASGWWTRGKLATAAAIVAIALIGFASLRRPPVAVLDPWDGAVATQITDRIGPEMNPSLLPDGQSLVYAAAEKGDWQIYLQRAGGRTPFLLTPNSPARDAQPAVSPDGTRIAFRSRK